MDKNKVSLYEGMKVKIIESEYECLIGETGRIVELKGSIAAIVLDKKFFDICHNLGGLCELGYGKWVITDHIIPIDCIHNEDYSIFKD